MWGSSFFHLRIASALLVGIAEQGAADESCSSVSQRGQVGPYLSGQSFLHLGHFMVAVLSRSSNIQRPKHSHGDSTRSAGNSSGVGIRSVHPSRPSRRRAAQVVPIGGLRSTCVRRATAEALKVPCVGAGRAHRRCIAAGTLDHGWRGHFPATNSRLGDSSNDEQAEAADAMERGLLKSGVYSWRGSLWTFALKIR